MRCLFFLVLEYMKLLMRESEREGRGKVELEDRMSQGLEVFVILSICI